MTEQRKPRVVADTPLADTVLELMDNRVELLPWDVALEGCDDQVDGLYTYGHLEVDGSVMDRLSGLKVISNFGVGVDHINVQDARDRGIPVGNTPNVLNGATADMALTLMLASGRRLVEGDCYARSAEFTYYDPGYMLGREIHSETVGIVGMGRIGLEVARRCAAFNMNILYYNRRERTDLPPELNATYTSFDDLLTESDYVVLVCPLTDETRGLIGAEQLSKMKQTAILINIARGGVVDTDALTNALKNCEIYHAGLDVTEPEPLPRGHELLSLSNVTIAPHLGSATEQTRFKMAELSVENLMLGLAGEPLRTTV